MHTFDGGNSFFFFLFRPKWARTVGPLANLQLLALDADRGTGGNGMGDEDIGADDAVPANDRIAAQNGSAGVDGHIVLNGGVAALAPQALAPPGGQCAQCHALDRKSVV